MSGYSIIVGGINNNTISYGNIGIITTGTNSTAIGFKSLFYKHPDAETRMVIMEKYIPKIISGVYSNYTSILGGHDNIAIGYSSVVINNLSNTATGAYTFING